MKRIAWIYRIGPRSTVTSANAAREKLPGLFFKINRAATGRLAGSDAARTASDLAFSEAMPQDDISACEAVQKGLNSGSYLAAAAARGARAACITSTKCCERPAGQRICAAETFLQPGLLVSGCFLHEAQPTSESALDGLLQRRA